MPVVYKIEVSNCLVMRLNQQKGIHSLSSAPLNKRGGSSPPTGTTFYNPLHLERVFLCL